MASLLGNLDDQATVKEDTSSRPVAAPVRRSKPTLARSALSASKRAADVDATSFRSTNNFASSSDIASDPVSDPFLAGGPSSDGFDSVKKARFDPDFDEADNDLGGTDPSEFDDFSCSTATDADPLGSSHKANGDVKMEDDDEALFVKPATPAAKPKGPAQRRQLVNASAFKAKSTKVETKEDLVPQSPMTFEDQTPKRKGIDWRTATSALTIASSPLIAAAASDAVDESSAFNENHKTVISTTGMRAPAQQTNALEPDGSLQFWWFDYDEPSPGVVRLVGKVRARGQTVKVMSAAEGKKVEKDVPKYVSATVIVKGLKRKLYVLPKSKSECESRRCCSFSVSLLTLMARSQTTEARKTATIRTTRAKSSPSTTSRPTSWTTRMASGT